MNFDIEILDAEPLELEQEEYENKTEQMMENKQFQQAIWAMNHFSRAIHFSKNYSKYSQLTAMQTTSREAF